MSFCAQQGLFILSQLVPKFGQFVPSLCQSVLYALVDSYPSKHSVTITKVNAC